MKNLLLIFSLSLIFKASAQEPLFNLTLQKQNLSISLDDENEEKIITLTSQPVYTKADQLVIINENWKQEKDWKRSFTLMDNEDNLISDIPEMSKQGTFCVSLENLSRSLKVGQVYRIYTVAYPRDPQQAMLVKVARRLLCIISIK